MATDPEEENYLIILDQCRKGTASLQEWETLYRRCYPNIYVFLKATGLKTGFLPESEIENLAQDIFIKLIERFPQSNFSTLKDFDNYLDQIVRNSLIDYYRQQKWKGRRVSISEIEHLLPDLKGYFPDLDYELKETTLNLRRAIAQLPERYRLMVESLLDQNMSLAEYANRNDIPKGTIYTQYQRCLEKLKKIFEKM